MSESEELEQPRKYAKSTRFHCRTCGLRFIKKDKPITVKENTQGCRDRPMKCPKCGSENIGLV